MLEQIHSDKQSRKLAFLLKLLSLRQLHPNLNQLLDLLKRKSQRLTLKLSPRIKSLRDLNKSFEQSYRILDFKGIHPQIQVVHHLKIKVTKIIRPIVALEIIPEDAIFLLHGVMITITLTVETVLTTTETETGIGILPTEVTTTTAKITIILASPLIKEGLKILIPRIIRIHLILKMLTNQHSRTLIKMVPKTSDSLGTLVAIDQVVSFVVMLVVTHGFMSKTETVYQQRLEETKILSPQEIFLGVLTTLFGDVVFVLILIVLIEMLA